MYYAFLMNPLSCATQLLNRHTGRCQSRLSKANINFDIVPDAPIPAALEPVFLEKKDHFWQALMNV